MKRDTFRKLHESGCFVIPNPWDIGTARYLQHLGFKALATTSAGFGFSRGLSDGAISLHRDEVLAHVAEIAAATDIPLNVDFQSGYGSSPDEVAESVRLCAQAGAAGLSIEDSTGDPSHPLFELEEALDRLRAARAALEGTGVVLTARAECFLVGHPDALRESIRRLQAYAEAGADVLYAPGPRSREDIQAIVQAAGGKPVNVLMGWNSGITVADLAEMGVRRVSVGSSLAGAAWGGFIAAATEIAEHGTFTSFDRGAPFGTLNAFFETAGRRVNSDS